MDPFFGGGDFNYNWCNQPMGFRQFPQTTKPVHKTWEPVQIPVQFSKPKPVNRFGFALKIQKAFRGFLVRKSMKRIMDVKKQVDLINETLSKREIVDLVRKDEKEQLRMSENLMSLVLKLDSVRGFDLGVRECRKRVTRKAIALQERIDSIVAIDLSDIDEKVENVDSIGTTVDVDSEVCNAENVDHLEEGLVEKDEKSDLGDWVDVVEVEECKDDKKRNNEMMERMMEDNAKMMGMMTALFESNIKQMEMLSALSNRVEMLDKAMTQMKKPKKQERKINSYR